MSAFVEVSSCEEEWRTSTRRVQHHPRKRRSVSHGAAYLWLRLACGHCVQRMIALAKDGSYKPPKRALCVECNIA